MADAANLTLAVMPIPIFQIPELPFENPQNRQNFQIRQAADSPLDPAHDQRVTIPAAALKSASKLRLGNPKLLPQRTQLPSECIERILILSRFSLCHPIEASRHFWLDMSAVRHVE